MHFRTPESDVQPKKHPFQEHGTRCRLVPAARYGAGAHVQPSDEVVVSTLRLRCCLVCFAGVRQSIFQCHCSHCNFMLYSISCCPFIQAVSQPEAVCHLPNDQVV